MAEWLRTARGVLRSLRIYHCGRQRRAAMDRLYGRFVKPGDLVFDVGAHVGDRVAAFRRLGARVVAVEPQPALRATLKFFHGRDAAVMIEPVALGRTEGSVELKLNLDNPTVSTASADFIRAADGARGWERQAWTKTLAVPMTTLDALIARHGVPAFVKIDVEGFEAEACRDRSQPCRSNSPPSSPRSRQPQSTAAPRSATLRSMPHWARARRSSTRAG
jgi:FkbM family methyltransferase